MVGAADTRGDGCGQEPPNGPIWRLGRRGRSSKGFCSCRCADVTTVLGTTASSALGVHAARGRIWLRAIDSAARPGWWRPARRTVPAGIRPGPPTGSMSRCSRVCRQRPDAASVKVCSPRAGTAILTGTTTIAGSRAASRRAWSVIGVASPTMTRRRTSRRLLSAAARPVTSQSRPAQAAHGGLGGHGPCCCRAC